MKIYVKGALSAHINLPGIGFKDQAKTELGFNTAETQKVNLGFEIPLAVCCVLDHGITIFHQTGNANWEVRGIKFQMLYAIINTGDFPTTRPWLY